MTYLGIQETLSSSGIPFVHGQWDEEDCPPTPYGVFSLPESSFFFADNQIYEANYVFLVHLYTKQKEPSQEQKVEEVLDRMGLSYRKSEDYIKEEKVYQIEYEMEVILDDEIK